MNTLLANLLSKPEYATLIQERLPAAFQTVEAQLRGNPAVGLLREQVILGLLVAACGEGVVDHSMGGVQADIDCYVDEQALSIKTVSYSGGIRLKWTSNAVRAQEFVQNYNPVSDLLIVRINWGSQGSLRYVPLKAQEHVFHRLDTDYLDYRGQTNTRGVNLSGDAKTTLNTHPDTVTLPIFRQQSAEAVDPIAQWIEYWNR